MGFLNSIKDKTVSFIAEKVLKSKFERYGTMLDFKINSEEKNIYLKINLKGEAEPLEIRVKEYSLITEEDENYLLIGSLNISKEWIDLLADDFLKGQKFKLPKGVVSTLGKMVL